MTHPEKEIPPQAVQSLMLGRSIDAIKVIRKEWGIGLKEAKDAVDAYVRARPDLAARMAAANAANLKMLLGLFAMMAVASFLAYWFVIRK